jgi:hypothetical protein
MDIIKNSLFKQSVIVFALSLFLGVAFDYFFFTDLPGIGFPLYILMISAGMFSLARYFKKSVDRQVIWLQIPLAFFSFMVFVRASFFLTFLNAVACFLLLLLIARLSAGYRLRGFNLRDYSAVFTVPFEFISPFFRAVSGLFDGIKNNGDRTVIKQVAKGLAITIPVIFVLSALLSSADPVFSKYVSIILSLNVSDETIVRIIEITAITSLLIGAYSYFLNAARVESAETSAPKRAWFGQVEASILLGSVSALFLVFIILQITYLFGGQNNISAQGFTYAEYARRGFFELIAVAVISFLIVWLTERFIATAEGGHARLFKILSGVLIAEVMVIIASAFTRLWLYEEAYGFTELRLYSHIFVVLLACLFVLLLYKIIRNGSESAFLFRSFIVGLSFLAVINIMNPDALIAGLNVNRYHNSGKIDVGYLNTLSDDATPTLVGALPLKDSGLNRDLSGDLLTRLRNRESSPGFGQWQYLNLSHDASDNLLRKLKDTRL